MEKWKASLDLHGDELIEGCDPSSEVLDIFDHPRGAYLLDSFNFLRIGLNPPIGDHGTEKLPRGNSKGILGEVQLLWYFCRVAKVS